MHEAAPAATNSQNEKVSAKRKNAPRNVSFDEAGWSRKIVLISDDWKTGIGGIRHDLELCARFGTGYKPCCEIIPIHTYYAPHMLDIIPNMQHQIDTLDRNNPC